MTEKTNFSNAFKCLLKNDGPIVKEVITSSYKWCGPNLFYKKMSWERIILKCSQKGIDEFTLIESVFNCYGQNAETGVKLTAIPNP